MNSSRILILSLILIVPAYIVLHHGVWEQRKVVREATRASYVIPSEYSRILAFGFKGLLSDFQFLKTMVFCGDRFMRDQRMNEDDWAYFIASIDSVTDLDPYFFDPYILSEGMLAWSAGKVEEANRLLEKGYRHRTWDWRIPFFIGFNYFYFQKDYTRATDYIVKASQLSGAPEYLTPLASRLAYYGGKTRTGIVFLKGLLAEASGKNVIPGLEKRLLALEAAEKIELLIEKVEQDQGVSIGSLDELKLQGGYTSELPTDPYGGSWYVTKNGRVFSTSRFVEKLPARPDSD